MASTEEVLKALQNAKIATLSATEPEELVIDAETRTITVPSSERLFGVTGDMNIERKYFRCPKIVGDNIDLSTHQIFIAYVYTETESGSIFPSIGVAPYHCEDVEVDGEDITFSWKLTGNVFKNPGFILFKMYAKRTEADPNTVFNTTPAIGTVLATIPDGTEEIVEEYPDVIAQIFDRLDALESGGGGTGGTTNYENLSNKPQLNGVTLEGNKTLDQVGVLSKNQGSNNSGKFLSVGSDGNVVPADAPSGGTVDPEQIEQAVNGYLEENPPSGMTSEQEEQLGKVWIEDNPSYTITDNRSQIFDTVENGKANKITITDGSDYWDGEPEVSYPGTLNVKTLRENRFYANMWLPNGMDMDQSYRYAADKNGQIRLYDILNQKSDLTGLSPWGICLKGEGKSFPTGQCHFIISKIRVLGLDSNSGKWKLVKTCKPIAALFDIAQTSAEGTFVDVDRTVLSDDMYMFSIRQSTSWTMAGDMCFHFYPENTDAVTKEDIQDCSRILIAFRIRVQEAENSGIFTCSCGCDALGGTGVEAFFSRFNAVTDTLQELSSNNCLESESNILTDNLEAINELIYKEESVVSDEQVKGAVDSYLEENPVSGMTAEQEQQLNQNTTDVADLKSALTGISLGVYGDKVYILLLGEPVGEGLDVSELMKQYDTVVFIADFTGTHPSDAQFYTWDGRIYDGAIYDSLQNIQCSENTVKLKSSYDNKNSRWIKQMMCTAGLFESDDFVCEFSAKFCGLAGSWNNVITYGTGTYWTDGMYSDGVKWPAGGEIDAFEQAGGYSDTPDKFTLAAHWGSGTTSGYPNTHSIERAEKTGTLSLDEWADYKFKVKNGIVSCYVNDEFISSVDLSGKVVNNNYLYNYKPFLKPQAFYIDGSCASSGNDHTNNVYVFEVKDFKILQNEKVECNSLEIFPQMWEKGTSLKFPVESEIFFDKIFSPKDVSNKACTWESSEPLVATVTHGFVKTLKAGKTIITAKCGTATARYELEVSNSPDIPCAGLEASSYNISGPEGSRIPLTLYKYPSFTTDSLENHSDNSEVAYFDNSRNEIVLVSEGNTNIKINCGGKSVIVSCKVTSSYITGYDFTKSVGEDMPETYDIPDFVPGQTYTVSYKIGKLSTSSFYARTILQPKTGATVIPPLVGYNTDGTIEVNAGSGSGIKITANVGDWVSIVFEVPISGNTHANVYVNGIEKEDVNPVVHKDYLVTNSSRRPYQSLRDNAQGYSSRVEVYYGDMHNLYVRT